VAVALAVFAQPVHAQLEEVVVTAQKRAENLQVVPIAVSSVSEVQMELTGATEVSKLSFAVPGLNLVRGISSIMQPCLRGVGSQGTAAGDEPSVATYLDGFYLPIPYFAVFSFANIEQVNVLKGPRGTLIGRNASGGIIQIVTQDPSETAEVRAGVSYQNYDTY
jgi:iron complex outermembrane receptor protein